MRYRILVVDDTDLLRSALKRILEYHGFTVIEAEDAEHALGIDLTDVDLVVTDFSMPGKDGLQLARDIKGKHPRMPIVLHTGSRPDETHPADAVVDKPAAAGELEGTIHRLIAAR